MKKHLGKRERMARKTRKRGTITTSDSGWLTFKLGRRKFSEFMGSNWKKFNGCVVNAER